MVDIAFPRVHLAVFVDGCFWHSCPLHGSMPKANAEYWSPKLARNVERDRETTTRLGLAGWVVARFWEHESPSDLAHRTAEILEELTLDPA
jgi:DNA mismatch endonuclease (patch repair protein)